jgi:hypothetical protein
VKILKPNRSFIGQEKLADVLIIQVIHLRINLNMKNLVISFAKTIWPDVFNLNIYRSGWKNLHRNGHFQNGLCAEISRLTLQTIFH